MRKTILFLFALFCTTQGFSARDYFQQEVNYNIRVRLNDENHTLLGFETIEYINHSPDTLQAIYMHLWPNAYRNDQTALARQLLNSGNTKFYNAGEKDRGFIDSLDFKVNGEKITWRLDSRHIDIAVLQLTRPLPPGGRIQITTPFFVKIPLGIFSRLGHIEQQYQITQWYPKPAVYDKDGWHAMPYLNQGEFYSEFGSYDVSIELPKNYVVGATGDLQNNPEEMRWMAEKALETEAIKEFGKDLSFPPSDPKTKVLRFKQDRVHDFAWFADKRYHVLHGQVKLPHSGRTVSTWVLFTNDRAQYWKDAIGYVNDAIHYYSLWNGDYPYNQATAVDGALSAGGGMEYPTITVIGRMNSAFTLDQVIAHEVGHNWFYGILGSNERMHPWMDEGLNSFNELRYVRTKYPNKKLLEGDLAAQLAHKFDLQDVPYKTQTELTYLFNARRRMDQAVDAPAAEYTQLNYAGVVYAKTALIFDYLMAWVGEETMNKAMQRYFDTWKFKHPQPADLKKILEEETGKDLTWFFDGLVYDTKWLDYKLANVSSDGAMIVVVNKGSVPGPFSVSGIMNDSVTLTKWFDGFEGRRQLYFSPGTYDYLRIDAMERMPEARRTNNAMRTAGAFRGVEKIKLQMLASLENPMKTYLFYTPLAGWNRYNGTMLGMALYNSLVPQKKFEWMIAPMYGLASGSPAGGMQLTYHTYPLKDLFQSVRLKWNASSFALSGKEPVLNYYRIAPEADFRFRKARENSPLSHNLRLRSVHVIENRAVYDIETASYKYASDERYFVNELAWHIDNKRVVNPSSIHLAYQYGMSGEEGDFGKVQAELRQKISFRKKNKGIEIRLFAGRFLFENLPAYSRFGYGMSGNTDYTYDQLFLERNHNIGFFAQQFGITDGGFKNLTEAPHTTNWLNAANVMISLPGGLPLWLYGDIGASQGSGGMVYDAGIAIRILPDLFEIYLPFAMSSELNQVDKYVQKIRYTFNLYKLNPFEALRNASL